MENAVNHPDHYKAREMECIDEMVVVFGKPATINFCKLNAWKYRYRADSKGKHDEDMAKSDWYIQKVKELQDSLEFENAFKKDGATLVCEL